MVQARSKMRAPAPARRAPTVMVATYDGAAVGLAPAAPADRSVAPKPATRARIVYIEDDPDLRDAVGLALRRGGHEVVCAGNGREGLEEIAKRRPDLVISDGLMPVMNGEEVLRALRGGPEELRETPFIFLTASVTPQQTEDLEHGADDYLAKPLNLRQLYEAVDRLIGDPDAA